MSYQKRKVINGYYIEEETYDAILTEGKNAIKSLAFSSIWQALYYMVSIIFMAIVGATSETIMKTINYFIALILAFMFHKYIRPRLMTSITTHPLIWTAISLGGAVLINHHFQLGLHEIRITDLETRVDILEEGFEKLGAAVRRLDEGMSMIVRKMNDTYDPYIQGEGLIKRIDNFVGEKIYSIYLTLAKKPLTRAQFGLGCFMEGSQIQIDKYGNNVNVEQLQDGDYVFNPVLNKQIRIHTVINGPETGHMYQIMTNDSLSVTVTDTHPIKICNVTDINTFNCDNNIAAKHVFEGEWVLTKNGYRQIISIEKISVQNALVYNFMFDVPEDTLISSRGVIANGIVSLDLFAQKDHHQ